MLQSGIAAGGVNQSGFRKIDMLVIFAGNAVEFDNFRAVIKRAG
jgi:hypothetical protein